MQAASSENKFIHFGCWNQFECGDNNNPVSIVSKTVRNIIEEDKTFTDLIVAGDNYYPDKKKFDGKKQKTISTSDLTSGFKCLDIQGVTTYMLWGNHDLDNSKKLFVTDPEDDAKLKLIKASDCLTLRTELANQRDGLIFPDKKKIILTKIDGNTAFIMLDTTVYDIIDDDSDNTLSCYHTYYGVDTLEELKFKQHEAILEFVTKMEGVTNLILVGHHPLLYVKVKENEETGEKIQKTVDLHDIYPLLLDINNILHGVNYYYLCADYHNYQRGTVTINDGMKIEQYIVGTGGTKLDPPLGEVDLEKPIQYKGEVNATYTFGDDIHQHGFLIGTITPEVPLFKFVGVDTVNTGGRARKTRRKRTRKTRRKRTRKTRRH